MKCLLCSSKLQDQQKLIDHYLTYHYVDKNNWFFKKLFVTNNKTFFKKMYPLGRIYNSLTNL